MGQQIKKKNPKWIISWTFEDFWSKQFRTVKYIGDV